MAIVQGKAGDSIKAESELRALLDIFERRRGPDQDETLNCWTALALLLNDVGRPHEAVDEYREILERRERTLGMDDLKVARIRRLLGDAYVAAIEYSAAIEQFEKAEPVFEKNLGPENPETLLNRSNLAMAEGEHHMFEKSQKELKEILTVRERLFGPDEISVLMTCFQLARVLGGDGRYEEALIYAERAREAFRKMLKPSSRAVRDAEALCVKLRADLKQSQTAKDAVETSASK